MAVIPASSLAGLTPLLSTDELIVTRNGIELRRATIATLLASPDLTDNPTATTQAAGNSSTRIANTAFVAVAVAEGLDDLTTDDIEDMSGLATDSPPTLTGALLYLIDSPSFTGNPTVPTQDPGDSSTRAASTAFTAAAVAAAVAELTTDGIEDVSGLAEDSPPTLTGALQYLIDSPSFTGKVKLKTSDVLVTAHGMLGATETFDAAASDVHSGTLDQACTFTLSNPSASGRQTTLTMHIYQDGTGGFAVTWPASVKGDPAEPAIVTTAGTLTIYTLGVIDGGTSWIRKVEVTGVV